MHTLMIIAAGLLLLALFCLVGRTTGGAPGLRRATWVFVPVWAVASLANLTVGVVSAGYTVLQEIPFLIVVFSVPALAAWLVQRRARA